jgi:hypothetical protein
MNRTFIPWVKWVLMIALWPVLLLLMVALFATWKWETR